MSRFVAIAGLFLFPCFAFGQTNAGFPDRSVWLSNAKPAHGEEVRIYTVVYNGTDDPIEGKVAFLIDGEPYDFQPVSLEAQSSAVVAAKWRAVSGTHVFAAQFNSSNATATSSPQATTVVQIQVPEPPPPTAVQETVTKATEVVQQLASSSAPIVLPIAQKVFEKTEALRTAGVEYLESKIDAKPAAQATPSTVTGFAQENATTSSSWALHDVGQLAASAALFTMKSVYLFYPLFALLFFYLLYRAIKFFRRPQY